MKELTIKVFSFDELPKEAQDKIIEVNAGMLWIMLWSVAEWSSMIRLKNLSV